jgi:hypothetical protein
MPTTPNRAPAATTPTPPAPLPSQPATTRPAAESNLLAPPGTEERWWQLQGLRRGRVDPGPWLAGLESGELPAHQDLLESLLGVLDRAGVERLLANPRTLAGPTLLEAGRRELPPLAGQERVRQAWLEPLLGHHLQLVRQDLASAESWLELLGPFRDPAVAARLRQALQRHLGSSGQRPPREVLPSGATAVLNPGAALAADAPAGTAAGAGDAAAATRSAAPDAVDAVDAVDAINATDPADTTDAINATDPPDPADPGDTTHAIDALRVAPTATGPPALQPTAASDALSAGAGVEALAPLLGLQRQPQDGALLLELALAPGPLVRRRAALEGLALGLSAWPQGPLSAGLIQLSGDLDPQLAAAAVDLLARLPQGSRALRRVARQGLDPAVRARLRRRLPSSPLVLLVHGRQGGQVPPELQALAAELRQARGGPVLLQTLTAREEPKPEAAFWAAAQRAGGLTLVPLLLLPGGHVRHDLPALARTWRQRARAAGGLDLWRCPFLGAWPTWQRQLRRQLLALAADQPLLWLHHPLEGPLGARYLAHLTQLLGHPGQAAPLEAGMPRPAGLREPGLLVPWSLAANRMSEALTASGQLPGQRLLPPFLQVPGLRHTLLELLCALA